MIRYYPSPSSSSHATRPTATAARRIHILALQGHPEFLPPIIHHIVSARSASGVIDRDTAEEGWRREARMEGGDGRGVVGWGIWRVLLQD
jgi:hypothetical protein